MSMKITEKGTKKFTKKEKLSILAEAKKKGVKVTLEKYCIYPGTFYYWRRRYSELGEQGMDHGSSKEKNAQIKALEKENAMLKQLLAEEKLEGKLKDELLKKKYPHLKKFL